MKTHKTNAMRILDRLGVDYKAHDYVSDGTPKSGVEVAGILGVAPARIFKTLLARADSFVYVFVIPADRELDLKAAAAAAGVKKLEMLPAKEIFPLSGYHRGGCSPLGMKKDFPTVIDANVLSQDSVFVSAGKIGAQIEVAPESLIEAVHASVNRVSKSVE